jgi:rhodanese-related sulfurtransferase
MQKRYILIAVLFIGAAAGLLFLPNMKDKNPVKPTELLKDIHSANRFISTDQLAKRIIDEDPIVFLVDVREKSEFEKYSLPGALNIPLSQLLNEDWRGYIDQNVNDVIFFSNDDVLAEQAWVLCKQLGYKNLYVLDGGLNYWFETIMQPKKPADTDPIEAFDLYAFRTGASIYFGAGSVEVPAPPKEKPKVKKEIPVQKKVKAEAEGGC